MRFGAQHGVESDEQLAHAGSKCPDAVNNLEAATVSLRNLPENPDRIYRELMLQITLGQAYTGLKSWAAKETELAFTHALEICERLTAPPELFFVLYGLLSVYHVRGLFLADRDCSYQLLEHAKSASDLSLLLVAHYAIGAATFHTGELLIAREHQEIVLSLYDRERDAPLALRMASDPRQGMLSHSG